MGEADGHVHRSFAWMMLGESCGFEEDIFGVFDDSAPWHYCAESNIVSVSGAVVNTHLGVISTIEIVIAIYVAEFSTLAWHWSMGDGQVELPTECEAEEVRR